VIRVASIISLAWLILSVRSLLERFAGGHAYHVTVTSRSTAQNRAIKNLQKGSRETPLSHLLVDIQS